MRGFEPRAITSLADGSFLKFGAKRAAGKFTLGKSRLEASPGPFPREGGSESDGKLQPPAMN